MLAIGTKDLLDRLANGAHCLPPLMFDTVNRFRPAFSDVVGGVGGKRGGWGKSPFASCSHDCLTILNAVACNTGPDVNNTFFYCRRRLKGLILMLSTSTPAYWEKKKTQRTTAAFAIVTEGCFRPID